MSTKKSKLMSIYNIHDGKPQKLGQMSARHTQRLYYHSIHCHQDQASCPAHKGVLSIKSNSLSNKANGELHNAHTVEWCRDCRGFGGLSCTG